MCSARRFHEWGGLLRAPRPSPSRVLVGHADYDMAALLGFVKPQLGHLMAALQIDPGAVDSDWFKI